MLFMFLELFSSVDIGITTLVIYSIGLSWRKFIQPKICCFENSSTLALNKNKIPKPKENALW